MTGVSAERAAVIPLASLVALLILISAFFTDNRPTYMDEFLMFSPSYMLAHYGTPTFAIQGFPESPVIVHPPLHVGVIGLLLRLGCTWYYAEAVFPALFLLLSVWVVARGEFPLAVKLGLLFGLGYLLISPRLPAAWFATRPEGELQAAWLAGLLLLESGRLGGWRRGRLFSGAIVLAWASCVHYYAAPALAGVAVYAVWAVRALPWKGAKQCLMALLGGAAVVVLPYLILYVAPHFREILGAIRAQTSGNALSQHLELYRFWASTEDFPVLLRYALKTGIPLVVFATPILFLIRGTRGIALAGMSLPLAILFLARHKQGFYLVHELSLFCIAETVGAFVLLYWFAERLRLPSRIRAAVLPAAAAISCLSLASAVAALPSGSIYAGPHVHPGDLTRAAAQQILGKHARVVGRPGSWYIGGGESWHDPTDDLLGGESPYFDPVPYLENFDATVNYYHFSGVDSTNHEHKTFSAWYASGLLKLRGFFLPRLDGDNRLILAGIHQPAKVTGFAEIQNTLFHFEESAAGNYRVITAACPDLGELRDSFETLFPRSAVGLLQLPASLPGPPSIVATVLTPLSDPEPAGLLASRCSLAGQVRGAISPVDKDALIAALRHEDIPLHVYMDLAAVPGFKGLGVPKLHQVPSDVVPLEGAVNLQEATPWSKSARIENSDRIRVTTPAGLSDFAVNWPIHGAGRITVPFWIRLRLKVLSGVVGFAAFNHDGYIIARSGPLLLSPEPLDVALPVSSPKAAEAVVLFNARSGGPSRVEVLDVALVASPKDVAAFRQEVVNGQPPEVPEELRPPAGAQRLDGLLRLTDAQPGYQTSVVERLADRLRVVTPDLPGAFGVSIPFHSAETIHGTAWVQVRLRVLAGRVGLVVQGKNGISARSSGWLLPTAQPVDAALRLPAVNSGDQVILFNGNVASASRFELLDISVQVAK